MRIVTPGTLMRTRAQTLFDPLDPSSDNETFISKGTDLLVISVWSKTLTNVTSMNWVEVLWEGRTGFVHSSDLETIDVSTT
jgi:hypothetical protein